MKAYKIYLGILLTLNLLPLLAPIFWTARSFSPFLERIGELIYFIYSFTCHQFAWRSFYAFDAQWAWCARDVGIWLGILLMAFLARNGQLKAIKFYWVLPFLIPIALDGGVQTMATLLGISGNFTGLESNIIYMSSNFTRFLTGFIFGVGVSWFVSPNLWHNMQNFSENLSISKVLPSRRALIRVFAAFVISYTLIMGLWNLTSSYKTIDILDSAPKTPINDLFIRRESGPCKTDLNDVLSLECFF